MAEARRRTLAERRYRALIRTELDDIRQRQDAETKAMRHMLKEDWTRKRAVLADAHQTERSTLANEQKRFTARFMRVVDVTGRTRRTQEAAREALQSQHEDERTALVDRHRQNRAAQSAAVEARYSGMKDEIRDRYRPGLRDMTARHRDADIEADKERQSRVTEREREQRRLDEAIRIAERMARDQEQRRKRKRGPSR